ncbi:Uncharacterized protein RDOM_000604 [Rhyzopertha dominica]|nr:Uncharacterized protein RDOM_000604 [Rhyzopertha dominica]
MQRAPALLRTLAARQVSRRGYHHGHEVKPYGTYDDLPSPQGSWQTQYDANQRRYNAHLALGIATLAGTILFGQVAGLWELNWAIPERPADIPNHKD